MVLAPVLFLPSLLLNFSKWLSDNFGSNSWKFIRKNQRLWLCLPDIKASSSPKIILFVIIEYPPFDLFDTYFFSGKLNKFLFSRTWSQVSCSRYLDEDSFFWRDCQLDSFFIRSKICLIVDGLRGRTDRESKYCILLLKSKYIYLGYILSMILAWDTIIFVLCFIDFVYSNTVKN